MGDILIDANNIIGELVKAGGGTTDILDAMVRSGGLCHVN